MRHLFKKKCILLLLAVFIFMNTNIISYATDYDALAEQRKELPIQSNEIAGWPQGPEIGAESAILMEVNTGTVLYAKNINEHMFPASTTKIMTCLLAAENANLDDTVTFSYDAIHSVPADGSNIGMDAGEFLSLEECLYGIMVGSANEVANAVAEHISGSIDAFVDLMNERAASLGCTDTHFSNTNGLQDSDHYTSAHDLALIGKAFFSNELLCRIGNTGRYHFTPSAGQPDDFYLTNKHKLINGEIPYEGIAGGKTGYTDLARETLVTCAERGNMKLVCVVLMEESPSQFTDTVTLFDYGFGNFKMVNVKDEETGYIPENNAFFISGNDIFGSGYSVLDFDKADYVCIPQNMSLSDTERTISYDNSESESSIVATINYSISGTPVGKGNIVITDNAASKAGEETTTLASQKVIYINIKLVLIVISIIEAVIIFIIEISALISTYTFGGTKEDRKRLNRRKKEARKRNSPRF